MDLFSKLFLIGFIGSLGILGITMISKAYYHFTYLKKLGEFDESETLMDSSNPISFDVRRFVLIFPYFKPIKTDSIELKKLEQRIIKLTRLSILILVLMLGSILTTVYLFGKY